MDWRKHTVEVSLLLCRCQWSAASVQSTRVPLHRHAYASALLVTPCVNNGAVGKQTNASAEESAIVQPSALGGSRDSVKGFASRLSNFCASFARVVFRLSFPLSAFRILQFFGFLFLLLPRGTLAPHAKKFCTRARAVSAGRILTANPQSQTACCWHWHWHWLLVMIVVKTAGIEGWRPLRLNRGSFLFVSYQHTT